MTRANPLPDDVETLKAMLLSQEAALRERDAQMLKLQETVDSQQAALASRAAEVEHLKLLIAKLRRMQFGRKSEKLDAQIEQLELRLEELPRFVSDVWKKVVVSAFRSSNFPDLFQNLNCLRA